MLHETIASVDDLRLGPEQLDELAAEQGRFYALTVSRIAGGLPVALNPPYVRSMNRRTRLVRPVPMIGHQLEMGMSRVRPAFREVLAPDGLGKMLEAAEEAARLLRLQGIEATVWDLRVVKPLDPAMIADAALAPLVVTAEDGVRAGGAGVGHCRRDGRGRGRLRYAGACDHPWRARRLHRPGPAGHYPRRARPGRLRDAASVHALEATQAVRRS